jgi:Glycosyl transferase family 2
MKLVMTIHVRDEEEILDANLRYHLGQGVDLIVAMDNNSRDGTREILDRYAREGLAHVIDQPADDWDQVEWVTQMARTAATDFGADWVINNDADEFWCPPAGAGLKDVFGVIPKEFGALEAPRFNFIPRPGEGPFWDRMVVCELETLKWRGGNRKWVRLSPKVAHRGSPTVTVGAGSHKVLSEGFEVVPGWHPVTVFHYHLRSYEQLERKVQIPEEAIETNRRRGHRERAELHDLFESGRLREFYEAKLLDDAAVEAGLREGRLVVDRRVQRAFGGGLPSHAEGETGLVANGLALDMWRAVRAARRTEGEREKLEHKRNAARQERLERKLAVADARQARAARRLRQARESRWWRLGRRLRLVGPR